MNTTKRLLKAIELKSGRVGRDWLIPDIGAAFGTRLVSLNSGRPKRHGFVVFAGKAVSAEAILERARAGVKPGRSDEECIILLDAFVEAVAKLPLGCVVEVVPDSRGIRVNVVAKSYPTKAIPLPQ